MCTFIELHKITQTYFWRANNIHTFCLELNRLQCQTICASKIAHTKNICNVKRNHFFQWRFELSQNISKENNCYRAKYMYFLPGLLQLLRWLAVDFAIFSALKNSPHKFSDTRRKWVCVYVGWVCVSCERGNNIGEHGNAIGSKCWVDLRGCIWDNPCSIMWLIANPGHCR